MACDAVSKIAKLPIADCESINAVSMIHGVIRNNIISDICVVEYRGVSLSMRHYCGMEVSLNFKASGFG